MKQMQKLSAVVLAVLTLSGVAFLISCNQRAEERSSPVNKSNKITVYPHGPDFLMKHGELYQTSAIQCMRCHGADLTGGNAKVACQTCHGSSFPHPPHWGKPAAHGEAFAKLDDANRAYCVTCHIPTAEKPQKAIGCVECHTAYPHDLPANKGVSSGGGKHKKLALSFEGRCMLCHVNYTKNFPSDPEQGCKGCHSEDGDLTIMWKKPDEPQKSRRQPGSTPHSSQLKPVK